MRKRGLKYHSRECGILWRLLFILALLLPTCAKGAVLSQALEKRLQRADPEERIPVIAKFGGSPLPEALTLLPERQRRKPMIQLLRQRAQEARREAESFLEAVAARRIKWLWISNAVSFSAPPHVIREALNIPGVQRIMLDARLSVPETAQAPDGVPEWNIEAIGAPVLWHLGPGFTGKGITVAAVDTGADAEHPDLQSRWRGGANSWFNAICNDPDATDVCDLNCEIPCDSPSDPFFAGHGTGVVSLMVGGDAGGTAIGVAPGAQWIAAKVFNAEGLAWLSDILLAFQWILDPDGDPETDDAPRVLNNSWGFDSIAGVCVDSFDWQAEILAAVDLLRQAGTAVVFSAGNAGPSASTSVSPANYPGIFSVGAVGQDLEVSLFSSRGPGACNGNVYPNVVAPGSRVLTAGVLQSYVLSSGTSFSAPHAAGAFALLMEAFPERPLADLEWALMASATDLGIPGPDNNSGFGLINLVAAYNLLADLDADVTVEPLALDFGKAEVGCDSSTQSIVLTNPGPDAVPLQDIDLAGTAWRDFLVAEDQCSGVILESGTGCSVTLVFHPLSPGPKGAVLVYNTTDNRKLPVPLLSGNGELCPQRFADTTQTHWAFGYIHSLLCNGITAGCSEDGTLFCPDDTVTREQMAAFIVRALEGEPTADLCDGGSPFSDVSPESWSCSYIQRLFELGITKGFGDGTFRPLNPVTREQVAAFIVRALGEDPAPDLCQDASPFVDVPPESWSCGYIARISQLGITKGTGDGTTFEPLRPVTRAEAAAFVARAFLSMD